MKFSIIMPVYNKADTIGSSIKSILQQTYQEFEVIVIDDGSTDELESKIPKDERIRLIHQINQGVSVARNRGLENSNGEFICFLDADDLWHPDHLETMVYLIKKYPNCGFFVTSNMVSNGINTFLHSNKYLKEYDDDFLCNNFFELLNNTSYAIINTNSVCIARSIFLKEKIEFEPGIKIGEDTDVWYRVALKNYVAISKKETTIYQRENSSTTKHSFFVHDWIFSLREEDILNDMYISDNVKVEAVKLIDRYRMTGSRQCMLVNDRKRAKQILSKVVYKTGRRYWYTKIYTYLPFFVCEFLYKKIIG